MANSNWNKKRQGRTSSSREESGIGGSSAGSESQGDGFETGNVRQGGMSDSSGSSGSSGTSGLGGETSKSGEGDRPGGVEGTSTRDGRSDPDRTSQR